MNRDDLEWHERRIRQVLEELRQDLADHINELDQNLTIQDPRARLERLREFQKKLRHFGYRIAAHKGLVLWLVGWKKVFNLFEGK